MSKSEQDLLRRLIAGMILILTLGEQMILILTLGEQMILILTLGDPDTHSR
jgi:hypothetical protein